jgi:aspartate racemase
MHHMLAAYASGDYSAIRDRFRNDARKLAAAGADCFILPDNTAHIALELPGGDFPRPGLHIGEVVADRALRSGFRKVGILGTNWTMTGPVYPGALGRRGIDWEIPDEEDRLLTHHVIMDELCLGEIKEASRDAYVEIIRKLAARGCDSVALVCTEIPLLITSGVTARRAHLEVACGRGRERSRLSNAGVLTTYPRPRERGLFGDLNSLSATLR